MKCYLGCPAKKKMMERRKEQLQKKKQKAGVEKENSSSTNVDLASLVKTIADMQNTRQIFDDSFTQPNRIGK